MSKGCHTSRGADTALSAAAAETESASTGASEASDGTAVELSHQVMIPPTKQLFHGRFGIQVYVGIQAHLTRGQRSQLPDFSLQQGLGLLGTTAQEGHMGRRLRLTSTGFRSAFFLRGLVTKGLMTLSSREVPRGVMPLYLRR